MMFWQEIETRWLPQKISLVFVRRFLIEENNSYEVYEDLLMVIKNHYPNLRGCSLRSVKRFCTNHGIKKRMSVADGTVDIAVQGAILEVRDVPNRSLKGRLFDFIVEPR